MSTSPSLFRHIMLAAALALPALFGALPAEANVRTTVPGSECHPDPYWARQGGSFDVLSTGAVMWNNASTDASFSFSMYCPVSRHLPLSTDGMSDFEIRFQSTTAQASQPWCSVVSVRPDGTILQGTGKIMNLPGNTMATMDLGAGITKSANKGTYNFTCLLPLTVQLISLYHSENDGVSGN